MSANICRKYDLEVFDVEYLNTAGGSLRYYICRKGKYPITENLIKTQDKENLLKLYNFETYNEFKLKCEFSKNMYSSVWPGKIVSHLLWITKKKISFLPDAFYILQFL